MYNNRILATLLLIYKLIYDADYKKTDNIKLFYIVYLLYQKGIELFELYDFQWLNNKIYSFTVSTEIRHLNLNINSYKMENPVKLSNDALQAISEVKKLIEVKSEYDETTWIKALATAHYLKIYILSGLIDSKIVAGKLYNTNPVRFCNDNENIKICNLISNL